MREVKIAIIGAGAIGRAIGGLVKSVRVAFWDIDESKLSERMTLDDAVADAGIVMLCIPARATRDAAAAIAPRLSAKTIVLSVSKGLERETGKFMDELLAETLPPGQRFGLVFGPMLADELARGARGAATVASEERGVFEEFAKYVSADALILEYSSDIRGVAALGVLKNVYVIALGIAAGLGYESDMRGLIVKQAVNEMRSLLPLFGGNAETIFTNAGLGDLVATGCSPCSRNWNAGKELATSDICYVESEGLLALPLILKHIGARVERLPLLSAIAAVAIAHKDARMKLDNAIKSGL